MNDLLDVLALADHPLADLLGRSMATTQDWSRADIDAVTAIARRGKLVHVEAHGLRDVEADEPMAPDAIFRMASSTKPVTGVAVLMMMEEGRLQLTDPVYRYIPEFRNLQGMP